MMRIKDELEIEGLFQENKIIILLISKYKILWKVNMFPDNFER